MSKPATKEPSMDEILSSIRQIIADDDAAVAPPPTRPAATSVQPTTAGVARPSAAAVSARPSAPEPLALSPSQMISPTARPASEPAASADFSAMVAGLDEPEPDASEMMVDEAELIDPEDVAFEGEPDPEPEPVVVPPPVMRAAPPQPVRAPEPQQAPRPAMSVSQAAPLPDPNLSADMAEQLLAPATNAAVHSAMARLGAMQDMGIGGMTVEAMIRDMLKPMLKDWLDENLPALVESMVEREIARISRGVK